MKTVLIAMQDGTSLDELLFLKIILYIE